MPDVWTVTPTTVQRNGAPIVGYVSHALTIRSNTEGKAFTEVSLAVRIIDPHSEAAREAPLLVLSGAERGMVLAEYANHPTASEYRSKPGDTVTVSGTFVEGSGDQASSIAGSDPL